jgi:hypothetical protein
MEITDLQVADAKIESLLRFGDPTFPRTVPTPMPARKPAITSNLATKSFACSAGSHA